MSLNTVPSSTLSPPKATRKPLLSTDGWAVVLAIALAVLVRAGLLKVVRW